MSAASGWTLVLDASEVQFAHPSEGQLHIRLSAGWVRNAHQVGYLKPVELLFSGADWTGDLPLCMGALSAGSVSLDTHAMGSEQVYTRIPLPFSPDVPVRASFAFRSGATLSVSASALRCWHPDNARFAEAFEC